MNPFSPRSINRCGVETYQRATSNFLSKFRICPILKMQEPSLSPPIALPNGLEEVHLSSPKLRHRSWREAPFVVKICAFYLTLFAALGVICGLSMIAYVQLLRSNLWMLALCLLGISALIIASGWHLLSLRQGKKRGWYVQLIWSVGNTLLLIIALLFALISGTTQAIISETLETASPFGAYISLSHFVISLFWFQDKVKFWFGIA